MWVVLWWTGGGGMVQIWSATLKLDAMDKREADQLFVLCSLYYVGVVEFGEQKPLNRTCGLDVHVFVWLNR